MEARNQQELIDLQTQLAIQATVFAAGAALEWETEENRSKLEAEALLAKAKGEEIAERMGLPAAEAVTPTIVLKSAAGRERLLTFGPVAAGGRYAGNVDEVTEEQQEQIKKVINSLYGRARGAWYCWAERNGSRVTLDHDEERLVLRFASETGEQSEEGVGMTLTELPA